MILLQHPLPQLLRRHHARLFLAKPAVAIARHEVVNSIPQRPWQWLENKRELSQATDCAGDFEGSIAGFEGSAWRQKQHRIRRSGIKAMTRVELAAQRTLNRREFDFARWIALHNGAHGSIAQMADAIKEQQVVVVRIVAGHGSKEH